MPIASLEPSAAVAAVSGGGEGAAVPSDGFSTALAGAREALSAGTGAASGVTLGQMVALASGQLTGAPGAFGAPAANGPVGAATAAPSGDGVPSGNAVIDAAKAYLGVPYRWGGTDPATGLDCSGFIQRAFADLGVRIPRVSKDQSRAGTAVPSMAQARPGDLVYWNGTGGRPNHIGIYLGDGTMMHAPRTGDVVKIADVRSAPPDAIRRIT